MLLNNCVYLLVNISVFDINLVNLWQRKAAGLQGDQGSVALCASAPEYAPAVWHRSC